MKRVGLVAILILLLAACTTSDDGPEPQASAGAPTVQTSGPNQFDRLTMSLELNATEVPAGRAVGSRIDIRNDSTRAVRDPGCLLSAFSFALVPKDDPDAELWGQVVVDCAGGVTLQPGYVDRHLGPTFQATDKFGDPLPAGEYIATVAFERRSEPLTQPITITD